MIAISTTPLTPTDVDRGGEKVGTSPKKSVNRVRKFRIAGRFTGANMLASGWPRGLIG